MPNERSWFSQRDSGVCGGPASNSARCRSSSRNLLMLQVHTIQKVGDQRPQLRVENRFLFFEMDCGEILKLMHGRLNFGNELGSEAQESG